MQPKSSEFQIHSSKALLDDQLRAALARTQDGFGGKRAEAVAALPQFERIREHARSVKNHTLEHLDFYLDKFEEQVNASGGHVHWARTPEEGRQIILDICKRADAKSVIKGKSMVSEEMALNPALEQSGMEVVETDLGEYIIQLAGEPPSHIIAPAIHKTRHQISDLFAENHGQYGLTERVTDVADIVNEARQVLRQKFLAADVGITGANFLVAETGSTVLVTNEGNGDLTSTMPRVHIVTAGLEKVVPTLDDVSTMLRLLARSATGQEFSCYTSFFTGPKRADDDAGPEEFHIVLLDNGRTEMLGNEFREMLRCIRCGSCLNHCPVYGAIGGHAYGWVYSGPMGSVLTPLMVGLGEAAHLPNACTLNGRCEEVCPMSIPLPRMLRALRVRQFRDGLVGARVWVARRPRLYQRLSNTAMRLLSRRARAGVVARLPFGSSWTSGRDFPAPEGETFMAQWAKRDVRDTKAADNSGPDA